VDKNSRLPDPAEKGNMDQPTIIITGASYGLGAAIAERAAASRAQVVLAARSQPTLERQAEKIRQDGGKALAVQADVSRAEDCQKIIDQTLQAFGRIDTLVNNAAVIEPFGSAAEVQMEAWVHLMQVNLFGPVNLCQLALPHLRHTQGKVIQVTSHAADISIPGASAYSTSKAALNRFSQVLAVEEPAITVILFNPGDMDTPMQAAIRGKAQGKTPEEFYQYVVSLYEQNQLLPPEKSARAAVRLALHAPHAWSGEIIEWDNERINTLGSENSKS